MKLTRHCNGVRITVSLKPNEVCVKYIILEIAITHTSFRSLESVDLKIRKQGTVVEQSKTTNMQPQRKNGVNCFKMFIIAKMLQILVKITIEDRKPSRNWKSAALIL